MLSIKTKTLLVLFTCYLFIPSLILAVLSQPSYATGILLFSTIVIAIGIYLKSQNKIRKYSLSKKILTRVIVFFSFLFIHSITVLLFVGEFETPRFLGTIFLFVLMLLSAYLFTLIIENTSEFTFNKSLKYILYLFIVILISSGVLKYNPLQSSYTFFNRPLFPFIEPSHFALIFAPFYLWIIISQKKVIVRIFIVLLSTTLLFYIENLTLVCLISIGAYFAFGLKKIWYFLLPFIYVIPFLDLNLDYYTSRVDLSFSNENISTLVWLQGWQEASIYFKNTQGIGIGFQQFGVSDPKGDIANTVYYLLDFYTNRHDGGTFGAKLVGEFGIIGIVIILIMMYQIIKSFLFLSKLKTGAPKSYQLIFYHCCIFYFVLELFVRSTSYVAPGFFIFLVGLIGVSIKKANTTSSMITL